VTCAPAYYLVLAYLFGMVPGALIGAVWTRWHYRL
jgi:hypothetical protein